MVSKFSFEWDEEKNIKNKEKHGLSFEEAQDAFMDPQRLIVEDMAHSKQEKRFFCLGKTGTGIMTVRFTYRAGVVRIIGAGYWREGKKRYEQENKL